MAKDSLSTRPLLGNPPRNTQPHTDDIALDIWRFLSASGDDLLKDARSIRLGEIAAQIKKNGGVK